MCAAGTTLENEASLRDVNFVDQRRGVEYQLLGQEVELGAARRFYYIARLHLEAEGALRQLLPLLLSDLQPVELLRHVHRHGPDVDVNERVAVAGVRRLYFAEDGVGVDGGRRELADVSPATDVAQPRQQRALGVPLPRVIAIVAVKVGALQQLPPVVRHRDETEHVRLLFPIRPVRAPCSVLAPKGHAPSERPLALSHCLPVLAAFQDGPNRGGHEEPEGTAPEEHGVLGIFPLAFPSPQRLILVDVVVVLSDHVGDERRHARAVDDAVPHPEDERSTRHVDGELGQSNHVDHLLALSIVHVGPLRVRFIPAPFLRRLRAHGSVLLDQSPPPVVRVDVHVVLAAALELEDGDVRVPLVHHGDVGHGRARRVATPRLAPGGHGHPRLRRQPLEIVGTRPTQFHPPCPPESAKEPRILFPAPGFAPKGPPEALQLRLTIHKADFELAVGDLGHFFVD
ncbi:HAD family phosphatase [Babesia caballi]|uniref:HAD family phosphatase n=1 Tax=Babesia caballi TaxID=5871 RepID=A0AAV4LUN6_BABCB|nr:HAD family phosphatase [Babesia caballi]